MSNPTVRHAPEANRWEVHVDQELVGFAEYYEKGGRFVFDHTEVDDRFEGEGVGSTLVRTALDEVRSMNRMVVPLCPFVRGWIEKHDNYASLVDHQLLDQLAKD